MPKPGKSAKEIENWKPIIIEPLLRRIYSAIIDQKLSSTRQKRFRQQNGCKNNIAIFSNALTKMKEDLGGVVTRERS